MKKQHIISDYVTDQDTDYEEELKPTNKSLPQKVYFCINRKRKL